MQYVTPPWDHQVKIVDMSEHMPDRALLWEMGTGKTKGCIDILRKKYTSEGRLMKTLILAPLIALNNWKKEFKMHSHIDQKKIIILNQSGGKRCKVFKDHTFDEKTMGFDTPGIFLTNYEAMQMDELVEMILAWEPDILVCDEVHRCKNHKSKRAKKVIRIADVCRHKYILTGTLVTRHAMDIYNQYRILDGGKTFGKNFYAFQRTWFEDENAGWSGRPGYFPKFVPRAETYSEFNTKIYTKAMRVVKEECLDLPPLVKKTVEVELSPEQKRLYKDMRDEYLTFIEDKLTKEPRAVVAQLAITKALRLQQIVSGFVRDENKKDHVIDKNPRIETLSDLLEQLCEGNKVIVWAIFKQNYKQIRAVCEKLGIEYAQLHGDIPSKKRKDEEERFKQDPNCKVMIANQRAAGIAINLVEASYAIYYSRDFSLENDLQSEARNHRGGSEIHDKVTRIDLVSPGTIDGLIIESLNQKQQISDRILDWEV